MPSVTVSLWLSNERRTKLFVSMPKVLLVILKLCTLKIMHIAKHTATVTLCSIQILMVTRLLSYKKKQLFQQRKA